MKKNYLLLIILCIAHIAFAQVKTNSGNVGIGTTPNLKAKLLLYKKTAATDTVFGLHSTMNNTSTSLTKPVYGMYSSNANDSKSNSLYGAYFKNTQTNSNQSTLVPLYGIYIDNINLAYENSIHGVYVNNTNSSWAGSLYGFYANNTSNSGYGGNLYGIYLNNNRPAGNLGNVYGIYSTNANNTGSGIVCGAYLSATSSNANNTAYGLYATVSGGNANNRHAGYFTGGKVVVNGELWAWNTNSQSVRIMSDERLKNNIKPLTEEKDKLYLLQGKSYKKTLSPVFAMGLKEDSLIEKRDEKIVETPEYGYLAQELKEIFPDLVSIDDSTGFYAVNYIGLIPVIVEALKDQRLENEKQQTQIEEQREQIKQLVKLIGIKSIDEKAFEANGIESIPVLLQNTPNPFNQATEIGYFIPKTVSSANIYIYDIQGFQQKNISITERGKGMTILQATALQAGIYFYTLICDGKPVDTKQMILTR